MGTQARVAARLAAAQVGRDVGVLLEEETAPGTFAARTAAQAPEIDGTITVRGDGGVGEIVQARVVGADVYDLRAEIVSAVDRVSLTP